jgi:plastocyanin
MPKQTDQWLITGTVIDEQTRQKGRGFEVRLYDKDHRVDQHLGSTITNEEGEFEFTFSWDDFKNNYFKFFGVTLNFVEFKPDLFFQVHYDGDMLADFKYDLHRNMNEEQLEVELAVEFPVIALVGTCEPQDVYLKIEPVLDYSPVNPDPTGPYKYLKDCFRRAGHEDGTISVDESDLKKFTALVYREYTDATYTTLVTDKLIQSDLSEPQTSRKIPTVIYTSPGHRLKIHVLNCDDAPHSLHMHGLQYGIDSDGAYPLGVTTNDGIRSDAICPGESFTYTYDVKLEMVGAWVFHDHYKNLGEMANLGLIGGMVVRDPSWPKVDLEIPFFMHKLAGRRANPLFDSGDVAPTTTYARVFDTLGIYDYECLYHPMFGKVNVTATGPLTVAVQILDNSFNSDDVEVGIGGTVTWTNIGLSAHTVTEAGASVSGTSMSLNGRSHAGNTPVIEVKAGMKLRWYVFNHDFGQGWHNFHVHASHWDYGGQSTDNQSIGPAESFVVNTEVPPVVLPPCSAEHIGGKGETYKLVAHHPIHCHVEAHVMQGMMALLRIHQKVFLSDAYVKFLDRPLPLYTGAFECPDTSLISCVDDEDTGFWTTLAPSPVFAVHSAVLKSGKVILWSGHAELGPTYGTLTALYDPATNTYTTVPFADSDDLFCAGHTFLPDGKLMAGGGANPGQVNTTHIFDPVTEAWTHLPSGTMNNYRWYPTMVAMSDGRTAVLSGTSGGGSVSDIEVIDMSDPTPTWQIVTGGTKSFSGLYPGFHWIPSGDMFFTRTGWNSHALATDDITHFTFSGPTAGSWTDYAPMNYPDRKEGASVLLIDDTGATPTSKVFVAGGRLPSAPAMKHCEIIDITDPATTPGWQVTTDMANDRIGVSTIVLPNGKVMVVGGRQTSGRFDTSPIFVYEGEIYDPATDSWAVTPPMVYGRQYHSSVVLLPDARVFASGGVDSSLGWGMAGNQQTSEAYSPEYLTLGSQPTINAGTVATAIYGATISVFTPDASDIASVCLIAPGAVTHHTDSHQRYIKIGFSSVSPTEISVDIPTSADVAPPGCYMLFILDSSGAPSEAHFIQIG